MCDVNFILHFINFMGWTLLETGVINEDIPKVEFYIDILSKLDDGTLESMSQSILNLAVPDAAAQIVNVIEG